MIANRILGLEEIWRKDTFGSGCQKVLRVWTAYPPMREYRSPIIYLYIFDSHIHRCGEDKNAREVALSPYFPAACGQSSAAADFRGPTTGRTEPRSGSLNQLLPACRQLEEPREPQAKPQTTNQPSPLFSIRRNPHPPKPLTTRLPPSHYLSCSLSREAVQLPTLTLLTPLPPSPTTRGRIPT
jgi:hypothetical protein